MKNNKHLTSVTRRDLNYGTQSVQSSHAMIDFCFKYPEIAKNWHENSNYMCQSSVANEYELMEISYAAQQKGIKVVEFFEPDLNNQLTAICLEPGEATKKLTSKLPLMLKELKNKDSKNFTESLKIA